MASRPGPERAGWKRTIGVAVSAALLAVGGPAMASEFVWQETQKLLASDGAEVDLFGYSVAL